MSCQNKCNKSLCPSKIKNKPIIWILGGPGSGKGTQCAKIHDKYGFTHLSTGDLLRKAVQNQTAMASQLAAIMEKGELVPNEVVLKLLKEQIEALSTTSKGFLIDGYPREVSQCDAFEATIGPPTVVLYFEASSETLMKRLLERAAHSNRADDNEQTIKQRIKTFFECNDKILAKTQSKLHRINADRNVHEIFNDVQVVLDKIVAA